MADTIEREHFTREFFDILDEVFERHHGIFLDKGTSLLETLDTVTAEEASRAPGENRASLAAQVAHVTFYLEVLERSLVSRQAESVDWREIWRTVRDVTPEQWDSLRRELRSTYGRVHGTLRGLDRWDDPDAIGHALAILVHSACHLGSIRQALHVLRR